MEKNHHPLMCILAMILLLAACSPSSTDLTATFQANLVPTETNTPLPTKSPISTPTPSEIAIVLPSPSPTPTTVKTFDMPGAPVTQFIKGIQITHFEDFENWHQNQWKLVSDRIAENNGVIEMEGMPFRDTRLIRTDLISPGEGVIIDFNFAFGSQVSAYLDTSEYFKYDYKRMGVKTGSNTSTNFQKGTEIFRPELLVGNLTPFPDFWYSMLLAVDDEAKFLILIWDPEAPENRLRYYGNFSESWEDLAWVFQIAVNRGSLLVDNYRQFSFEELIFPK